MFVPGGAYSAAGHAEGQQHRAAGAARAAAAAAARARTRRAATRLQR